MTMKTRAKIIGAFFLIAMVTSLAGAGLLEPILTSSDYLPEISDKTSTITIGVILEMINALCVIGIAVFMYPVMKKYGETSAISYVSLRILESIACITAAFVPLSLVALSNDYMVAEKTNPYYDTIGNLLKTTRNDIVGYFVPLFFVLGAFVFYLLAFRAKFLPRFVSIWGLIGIACITLLNILNNDSAVFMILALPIILNEIFLGFWLIFRGFNRK